MLSLDPPMNTRFTSLARPRRLASAPSLAAALALATGGMLAQPTTSFFDFTGLSVFVPDGDPAGIVDSRVITLPTADLIIDVDVQIDLVGDEGGGFTGDLYAWLRYQTPSGTSRSILLNRPGRDTGVPSGYGDGGLRLVLNDDTANNVHTYRSQLSGPTPYNIVTGTWTADGRDVDPDFVTTSDTPTAGLGVFDSMGAVGTWTLFIADMAGGSNHQLERWALAVTQVPEMPPGIGPAAALAMAVGLAFRRSRLRHR